MKGQASKERLEEIRRIYRSLGLESEEVRKYLVALGTLPKQSEQERPVVFIEAGNTSNSHGEIENARLEPASE